MTHTIIFREAHSNRSTLGRLPRPYTAIAKSRERGGECKKCGGKLAKVATIVRGREPRALKLMTCDRDSDIWEAGQGVKGGGGSYYGPWIASAFLSSCGWLVKRTAKVVKAGDEKAKRTNETRVSLFTLDPNVAWVVADKARGAMARVYPAFRVSHIETSSSFHQHQILIGNFLQIFGRKCVRVPWFLYQYRYSTLTVIGAKAVSAVLLTHQSSRRIKRIGSLPSGKE